ncbi:hypothetical protein [Streptomyces solincola]|nr:hypothetical protein [Streptomyces solincola]
MVRPGVAFAPIPANHALYQRMGEVYAGSTRHTDEVYRESYEIFG